MSRTKTSLICYLIIYKFFSHYYVIIGKLSVSHCRIVDFASKIPLYFYLHKTVLFRILVIVGVLENRHFIKILKFL